ncbi:MAG: efflux RND transporter periplasmic adaptor subunit [Kofleriaceae bacterium]|nr:efflux RND transporter periplasmic adaptor subunit [Kofleriaceae bacterium]
MSNETKPATSKPAGTARWSKWALVVALVALAGVTALVWAGQLAGKTTATVAAAPRLVRVAPTKAGDAAQTLTLSATAEPAQIAAIVARSSGYIADIAVDLGDHVKRGQLLAVISAAEGVNDLQAARGLSSAAEELARLATISRDRARELTAQNVTSREDLDRAESDYKRAQASASAARATVERYATLTGYQRVVAPSDGVITRRYVDPGAMAQAGQTSLFQLAQTTELDLEFEVPQSWASVVTPGLAVEITSRELPGQPIKASVTRTAGSIDATTHTMHAEVRLSDKTALTPGSQVDVRITSVRAAPPIIVPARAVVARPEGTSVAVVQPGPQGPRVHWTKITVLRELGKDVEVLADGSVAIGAKLVISPPANLGDDAAIEIAIDPPAPPPAPGSGSGGSR